MFSDWMASMIAGETLDNRPIVGYPPHVQKDLLHLTLLCQLIRMRRDPQATATVQFGNWRMPIRIGRPIHWDVSTLFAFSLQAGCSDAHEGLCMQVRTAHRQVTPERAINRAENLNTSWCTTVHINTRTTCPQHYLTNLAHKVSLKCWSESE